MRTTPIGQVQQLRQARQQSIFPSLQYCGKVINDSLFEKHFDNSRDSDPMFVYSIDKGDPK